MNADGFYHIYNRANGFEKLFNNDENYRFFIRQYLKYVSPIVDTYAYCLIPNHFHFVIKIKSEQELLTFFKSKFKHNKLFLQNPNLEKLTDEQESKFISQIFSNFFNSYTKSFNKVFNRHGSLFSPNFKKKHVDTELYLQQLIVYVHFNPVHHYVNKDFENFKHSSYQSIISDKDTFVEKQKAIEIFNDLDNFKYVHQSKNASFDRINDIVSEDVY